MRKDPGTRKRIQGSRRVDVSRRIRGAKNTYPIYKMSEKANNAQRIGFVQKPCPAIISSNANMPLRFWLSTGYWMSSRGANSWQYSWPYPPISDTSTPDEHPAKGSTPIPVMSPKSNFGIPSSMGGIALRSKSSLKRSFVVSHGRYRYFLRSSSSRSACVLGSVERSAWKRCDTLPPELSSANDWASACAVGVKGPELGDEGPEEPDPTDDEGENI